VNILDIVRYGELFYNEISNDPNGRYRSWEHCFTIFNDARECELTKELKDYLCIHLAFYLASWGMYRGSSFLLQKDYRIHIPIIEAIMDAQYAPLWEIKVKNYHHKENLDLLFRLCKQIQGIYNPIRLSLPEKTPKSDLSNTLITKVLMGCMGCIPAYDRYFISGALSTKVTTQNFNSQSIMKLVCFYEQYYDVFETSRAKMHVGGYEYPQMKILDMCMWNIGYSLQK